MMITPVRNKDSNTIANLYESVANKKKILTEETPFSELQGMGSPESHKFVPGKAMSDPKYADKPYSEHRLIGKEARTAIYEIGKLLLAKLKGEPNATFPGSRQEFQKYVADLVVNNLKGKDGKALYKASFAIHIARNIISELEDHKVIQETGVERKKKAVAQDNKTLVAAVNAIKDPSEVFKFDQNFDYGIPETKTEEKPKETAPESTPTEPAKKPEKKKIKAPV